MSRLLVRASQLSRVLLIASVAALGLAIPAGAAPPPAYAGPHLVYRAANGHVHVVSLRAGWGLDGTDADVDATASAHTSSRAVGTPWGWLGAVNEYVDYRSADGHVHELWRVAGTGSWHQLDLTVAAKTKARAAGDILQWDGVLAYRGADGHLHALSWVPASRHWRDVDLTMSAHLAGKLASDPQLDQVDNFFDYRTTDGHIHLLTMNGSHVVDLDVWHAAHAKVAATGRPTTGFSNYGETVLYRGTDKHVHELLLPFGKTTWTQLDLTKLGHAPADVSGDPVGWRWNYDYLEPFDTVEYVDTHGHLDGLQEGLGSTDPDRGPIAPTPWSPFTFGPGYRSVTPIAFHDDASSASGILDVTHRGAVQLERLDDVLGPEQPGGFSAQATPAATGAMVYFVQPQP